MVFINGAQPLALKNTIHVAETMLCTYPVDATAAAPAAAVLGDRRLPGLGEGAEAPGTSMDMAIASRSRTLSSWKVKQWESDYVKYMEGM